MPLFRAAWGTVDSGPGKVKVKLVEEPSVKKVRGGEG